MFKFFRGTIEELLAQSQVNVENVEDIFDKNRDMSYDEAVACLMDEQKISKRQAQRIVNNVIINGDIVRSTKGKQS